MVDRGVRLQTGPVAGPQAVVKDGALGSRESDRLPQVLLDRGPQAMRWRLVDRRREVRMRVSRGDRLRVI
jgi:hypothetical protein